MEKCQVRTCDHSVSRPGHHFCYVHWKAEQTGEIRRCNRCGGWFEKITEFCEDCRKAAATESEPSLDALKGSLSSTRIAKHFGIANTRVNLILAELGWIEKFVKGWIPTERGSKRGGLQREMRDSGVPYVVWPESILTDKVFLASLRESIGDAPATEQSTAPTLEPVKPNDAPATTDSQDFRTRFPATFRATDGHMVRSRGEMLIDNWLYMQGLAHAIERRLPVEEDVYCDFYLPGGKVYIEYWGMENDPKYAKRMEEKKGIYAKYKLNLVELTDEEIRNLDDALPRLLIRYNIDCT